MCFPVRFISGFLALVLTIHITSLSWLTPDHAVALDHGIFMSEIMYDPIGSDTNHEWIEVFNNTSTAADLTGWKLFEASSNHSLSVIQGSLTLPSSGFAILTGSGAVFLADHPGFSGTVLDTTFSLSNTGEPLSLKNNTGSIVDAITYSNTLGAAGNGRTLERDDFGQFLESMLAGGTPGFRTAAVPVSNTNENAGTISNANANNTNAGFENENASHPNFNDNANVSSDNANHNLNSSSFENSNSHLQNGNLNSVVVNANQNADVSNINDNGNSSNTNSALSSNDNSNSGINTNLNAAFNNNGNNSPSNTNLNASNPNSNIAPASGSGSLVPGDLLINEIFPHPATGGKEWIEIFNNTDHAIDLSQFTVEDNLASPKRLSGALFAGQYRVLEPSPLSLNNDGDTVMVKTASGSILDQMQYGDFHDSDSNAPAPGTDQSLGRYPNLHDTNNDKNDFRVFGKPTKGTDNIVDNHAPVAIITVQYPYKTSGNAPFSLNLTGEDSYDPDGDALSYQWDYGDGFISSDDNPLSHKYLVAGSYTVALTVTDTWGARYAYYLPVLVTAVTEAAAGVSNANRNINSNTNSADPVHCASKDFSSRIVISEILPNPDGTDTNNEFIELKNEDEHAINLCGWQLDDEEGGSKPFTIKDNLFIQPGEYRTFGSKETRISLNNDEDTARLFDPVMNMVDHLSYKKAPQGKSLSRATIEHSSRQIKRLASLSLDIGFDPKTSEHETIFSWTRPTPGEPNIAAATFQFQGIIINEVLPNPDGGDEEGEFIELKNLSEKSVSLSGWVLTDGSSTKYTFPVDAVIPAQSLLLIPRTQSKVSLNNTTDTITILDSDGNLQDQIGYDHVQAGKSFSRFVNDPNYPQDSNWEWTVPTPGGRNERLKLSVNPDPAGGEFNKTLKVKLIANKPGAKIFYAFSGEATPDDYQEYKDPIVLEHTTELWFFGLTDEYDRTGLEKQVYIIRPKELTVTGSGAEFPATASGAVIINEIYPNPEGKDQGQEWIELANTTDSAIDLSNFYFVRNAGKHFIIPPTTIIEPHVYRVIPLNTTDFALGNTKDTIELRDPSGFLIDAVSYTETYSTESLVRSKDSSNLLLSDFPTPGSANIDEVLTDAKLDTDRDLVLDETENSLGTNRTKLDTDRDLLPDRFEIIIGSNPLKRDRTNEKLADYQSYLAQFFTLEAGVLKTGLYLKGKSFPKSRITISFWPESDPKKIIRVTDPVTALGNFSVKVPVSLGKGTYIAQAIVTDPLGTKSLQSRLLSFTLNDDYAAVVTKVAKKTKSSTVKTAAAIPVQESSNTASILNPVANDNASTPPTGSDPDLLEPENANFSMLNTNLNINSNANFSGIAGANNLSADITKSSSFDSYEVYLIIGGVLLIFIISGLAFFMRRKK